MATQKRYALTPEHRAQLKPWCDKWVANALSTKAMDEADREAMRVAVRGLYEAAHLTPPPVERIVFVPSPFVANFAGGFAAALWWKGQSQSPIAMQMRQATQQSTELATWQATGQATGQAEQATEQATRLATQSATQLATWQATRLATRLATQLATWQATWQATGQATGQAEQATEQATRLATQLATWQATEQATGQATRQNESSTTGVDVSALLRVANSFAPGYANFLVTCAHATHYAMWNGGNQWSGWSAFISFFRHVVRLPLDYSAWQHYETAALHGGPRVMHQEFCIISDRPAVLKLDAQNRPHCEDGPFCAWRDGSALWAWHGVSVPAWIIAHPEQITVAHIQQEQNAEIRRVLLERYGYERFLRDSGACALHTDDFGTLYKVDLPDDEPLVMVSVLNSTPESDGSRRQYVLRVPPTMERAKQAVAWSFGLTEQQYQPTVET